MLPGSAHGSRNAKKRARRNGVVSTIAEAPNAAAAPTSPRRPAGCRRPTASRRRWTRARSSVPRFGSSRTRPPTTASTPITGQSVRVGSCISRERPASRSATNSRSANLANSDGWIWSGPAPSQRVAPFTSTPRPGHHHQEEQEHRDAEREPAQARARAGGRRAANSEQPDEPMSGPHGLTGEVRPGRPGLVERDDRRRRQHHHQAEQVEHGDGAEEPPELASSRCPAGRAPAGRVGNVGPAGPVGTAAQVGPAAG